MVGSPPRAKRVLALAYACEPGKGSEPAAGWAWARIVAQLSEATIITRANNRPAIEAALGGIPENARLHFIYVDLPRWARFWKRGQRGVRLYYVLWQFLALRAARRLNQRRSFDLVWHITLANAWLGSVGSLVGPRFVYGPIGGGGKTPLRLLPSLGLTGVAYELVRRAAQLGGRGLNPLARLAWRNASLILVQNEETRQWFPAHYRSKCRHFQHAVLEEIDPGGTSDRPSRTAIFVGRLLPWKGLTFALDALVLARDWHLIVCGSGPDERRLAERARRIGVGDRVAFLGWQSRDEVHRLMREDAAVLLFPSLHDDSPFAVVEAMAAGLPVLCLDRVGPPMLAGPGGVAIDASGSRRAVATALAQALQTRQFPSTATIRDHAASFLLSARVSLLSVELERAGISLTPGVSAPSKPWGS